MSLNIEVKPLLKVLVKVWGYSSSSRMLAYNTQTPGLIPSAETIKKEKKYFPASWEVQIRLS
jgi:hypothetical protein